MLPRSNARLQLPLDAQDGPADGTSAAGDFLASGPRGVSPTCCPNAAPAGALGVALLLPELRGRV